MICSSIILVVVTELGGTWTAPYLFLVRMAVQLTGDFPNTLSVTVSRYTPRQSIIACLKKWLNNMKDHQNKWEPGWDLYKVVCKPGGNCACLETVANPHRQEMNPMWTQIIIRCVDLCTKPDVNGLMPKKPLSGSLRACRRWYTNILESII